LKTQQKIDFPYFAGPRAIDNTLVKKILEALKENTSPEKKVPETEQGKETSTTSSTAEKNEEGDKIGPSQSSTDSQTDKTGSSQASTDRQTDKTGSSQTSTDRQTNQTGPSQASTDRQTNQAKKSSSVS
jgi:hypothetical protein